MRRLIVCLVVIANLCACGDRGPPASAYLHWKDRLAVSAGLSGFFWPCYVKRTSGDGAYHASIPTDQCFKMDPPKRWRGLWFTEFEGSRFCPAPANECALETPGDKIWLEFRPGIEIAAFKANGHPGRALYAVDLIGRRTVEKGWYGGRGDYILIADKVSAVKQLAFQPELTEAEYDAEQRRSAKEQK